MPPREARRPSITALLRRSGTGGMMAMAKVAGVPDISGAILRMFIRNIHLSFLREEEDITLNSTENSYAPAQRDGEAPIMNRVRIARKPPTTPHSGNLWDETVNWEPNSKKWEGGLSGRSGRSKKKKEKEDAPPPFVLVEVPYDEWRKYYAKDRQGRYRGTHPPAEDCILLPEDEEKWRGDPPPVEAGEASEDVSPDFEKLQRSATSPEHRPADAEFSPITEEESGIPTQKEEAIFIESDGHTALQTVEEPKTELNSPISPTSPTLPTPLELPTSPTSPASESTPTSPTSLGSKKSWRDRIGKLTSMGQSSGAAYGMIG